MSERGPTSRGDHVKPAHAAGPRAPRAAGRLAAAAALLLIAGTGATTPARANATTGDGSFSVTPSPTSSGRARSYFDLTVAPGQQTWDTAIFSNTGPETEVLRISVSTGVTATNSGSAYQNPAGPCTAAGCWVTGLPATVTIAPGEGRVLRFQVTVPANAPAAQYLAGITVQPATPSTATLGSNGPASAKAIIINKVTAGVAVTVGALSQMTTALNVSAVSAGWIGTTPRLSIPVSNIGQTFARATGTISCATDGTRHTYDVTMSTVLPGGHAVLAVNAPDLASGSLPCTVRLDDGTDHPVTWSGTVNLPPANARKLIHTGNGTYTELPDTTTPPWAIALIVIGVLILATLLALLVLRRRQRRP
jgi:hypothetical protein